MCACPGIISFTSPTPSCRPRPSLPDGLVKPSKDKYLTCLCSAAGEAPHRRFRVFTDQPIPYSCSGQYTAHHVLPFPPPSTFFCLEERQKKVPFYQEKKTLSGKKDCGLIKGRGGEVCVQGVLLKSKRSWLWSAKVCSPLWSKNTTPTPTFP